MAAANNSFDGNTYYIPEADAGDPVWWFCEHDPAKPASPNAPCRGHTFAEFQRQGQELHGKVVVVPVEQTFL